MPTIIPQETKDALELIGKLAEVLKLVEYFVNTEKGVTIIAYVAGALMVNDAPEWARLVSTIDILATVLQQANKDIADGKL